MLKNKLLFLYIIYFFLLSPIYAQFTSIPDKNFERALIRLGIDSDRSINGQVLTKDISSLLSLVIHEASSIPASVMIHDLSGIQDFTSLVHLDIHSNRLLSVDLSKNINLVTLICHNNLLTKIDLKTNLKLENLDCRWNVITKLDISEHVNLKILKCDNNEIKILKVNNNTLLKELSISINKIETLDLSHNPNLSILHCSYNNLTTLDVRKNRKLAILYCDDNSLTRLDLGLNNILGILHCNSNFLKDLYVSNTTELTYIDCHSNQLTSFDLSQNSKLEEIYCSDNKLTSLNLKNGNNSLIRRFDAINNPDLYCILVDDAVYSEEYWPNKDPMALYSEDCTLPEAIDDLYTTLEDTILIIDEASGVLANDYDQDPLTATLESDVSHGYLVFSKDGSFVYRPISNFFGEDTFTYSANDGINGTSAATVTIVVEVDGYDVIVPNAFTPNGDQINDNFLPVYKGMESIRLEIYDTWGNLIYVEESNELIGWDGTIKNSKAENGNYLYKINGITMSGKKLSLDGLFTLIK